jgi:hypothetical protein
VFIEEKNKKIKKISLNEINISFDLKIKPEINSNNLYLNELVLFQNKYLFHYDKNL